VNLCYVRHRRPVAVVKNLGIISGDDSLSGISDERKSNVSEGVYYYRTLIN
jgi:hypothetical protein